MIEYDCEGCGVHVIGYGRDRVPRSGLCAVCEWFCENVPDPEEMIQIMRLTGHLEVKALSLPWRARDE